MQEKWQDSMPRPNRWRRTRRRLTRVVPVVVWVLAVAAAVQLYRRLGVTGAVSGFADDQPVTLAHLEPGVIRDVHVHLYDHVARGQVLVSMAAQQERIQLAAVEKDIERLRAEVMAEDARLRADNARATADVDDLARRFAVDRAAAHIDYLSQMAVDARDRILLRGSMVECEIVRKLHTDDRAAFRELNDIQTEVDALQAAIDRNTEALARKKQAFEEADRRWFCFVEHEDVEALHESVLTPLRLAIDVRQRDLEEVARRIDSHVLRAPIDGQVTTLVAHSGDHVEAGMPLVKISPTLTDRVVAYLPEHMIHTASVGASVTVNCLAGDGRGRREYTGTVVSLSATVDEAPLRYRQIPTYPIWGRGLLAVLNDSTHLTPGEAVMLSFSNRR